LSLIDIIIALIILGGAYAGYKDGFVVSLFSLIAIVFGILAAFKFLGYAMAFIASRYDLSSSLLPYIAFAAVFFLVVIIVGLVGRLIKAAVGEGLLAGFDQIAGALFGMVRAMFMLSVMIWVAESLKLKLPDEWEADSWLHSATANFAPKVTNWISAIIPYFGNVF
jgi:membrane protein required for colicin V production